VNKLIYSVGINDIGLSIKGKESSKSCPYYVRWHEMLRRCYADELLKRRPTYIGCTVCDEWLTFSVFKSWMEKQEWRGRHLDKDILVPGNKIYGPETCIFVPSNINNLLTLPHGSSGDLPVGVEHNSGKFVARISNGVGKRKYLGRFATSSEARKAYVSAKKTLINEIACSQSEPLRAALIRHAELLR
jgi:hypothetical protein